MKRAVCLFCLEALLELCNIDTPPDVEILVTVSWVDLIEQVIFWVKV